MSYSNLSLKAGKIELYEDAVSSDGNVLISANRTADVSANIDINLKPQSDGTIYTSKEDKTSSKVGGGFDAAGRVDIYTNTFGTELITTINIKLGSNISSFSGTKIIGENGGDAAYFISISDNVNGKIYKAEFICTDIPVSGIGGDSNIGIYAHSGEFTDLNPNDNVTGGIELFTNNTMVARKYQSVGTATAIQDLNGKKLYFFSTNGSSITSYGDVEFLVKLYGVRVE